MKKIRKLATKLLITTIVLISGMSMTVYGMTAKEVTAKAPKAMSLEPIAYMVQSCHKPN